MRLLSGNLIKKNFSDATKYKQAIEQAQRDRAAERKKAGVEYVRLFCFAPDITLVTKFVGRLIFRHMTGLSPFFLSPTFPRGLPN